MTQRNQITVEAESPPSAYAIAELVEGKRGAFGRTTALTAQRALLLAPGLYLVGLRGRELGVASVLGSVSITVFLIGMYSMKAR